jgi:tetratricopeptide (TPR) repeat protein
MDSLFAEAHFRLARCLESCGQFDRAKAAYERARDQDALLFRATNRINAIIREVSSRRELSLRAADVERRLEEHSACGIPGGELFWDHVHLNFAGNYYAAQSVFFALEKILREKQSIEKTDSLPTLDQCAKEMVYSIWDEGHIVSIMKERFEKPPFSNQAYHREQMDLLTHEYSSLQKALTPAALDGFSEACRSALEQRPDDWRMRFAFCNMLESRGRYPEAIDNYQHIVRQVPHYARTYSSMGAVFSLMGLRAQAIAHYKTALTINPRDVTALNSLGVELAKTGKTAEAAECFTKAFRFYPRYLSAHLNFANLLSEQKRFEEAKLHFDRALSLDSNHAVTYLNYGMSLVRQKHYREARQYIEKAVSLDSSSVNALMTLGNLLVKLGDLNRSARQFKRVLALDSANAGAKDCLARLEKMGVAVK